MKNIWWKNSRNIRKKMPDEYVELPVNGFLDKPFEKFMNFKITRDMFAGII